MNTRKTLIISSVAAFCLFTQVRIADATSIGAWFGKATDPNSQSCFFPRTGHNPSQPASVQSSCPGQTPSWDMPLLVSSSGHTVTIAISEGNVTCTLFGLQQIGTVFTQQTVFGSAGTLSMTATVPNSGSMLLRCIVAQGAGLHAINYNL